MAAICKCGHDLGAHPPVVEKPFDWPCRCCDCSAYDEQEYDNQVDPEIEGVKV